MKKERVTEKADIEVKENTEAYRKVRRIIVEGIGKAEENIFMDLPLLSTVEEQARSYI